jgi:hypothetical protein
MNRKEAMCKEILERLFPEHEFVKIRHPKIRNPETGRALELDCYCAELKLAVELQGYQHDKFIEFFHKTFEGFQKQQVRDLIKEGFCDIYEIELIHVPDLPKYENIEEFIIKSLNARDIRYSENYKTEISQQTKTCYKCGEEKTIEEFPLDKAKKDGCKNECKNCHNTYLQSSRNSKKTTSDSHNNKITTISNNKSISEAESFQKIKKLDMEFVSSILEKAIKYHEEAIYPPTNKFSICDSSIDEGSFKVNLSIIISKIIKFLIRRHDKIINALNIKITKDPKYNKNRALIVTLPEDILLSHREIEEFTDSLVGIEKKQCIVDIKIEDVDLRMFSFDFSNVIRNFLSKECGHNVDPYSINFSIMNIYHLVFKWPEEYSIPESSIDLLQKNIFDYILAGI